MSIYLLTETFFVSFKNTLIKLLGKQRYYLLLPRFNLIRELQRRALIKVLASVGKVLDLGCNGCTFTLDLLRISKFYIGLDINVSYLWYVFKRLYFNNVEFLVADARRLPFKDFCFDLILASSILQMIKEDQQVIKESFRILKNKSNMIITVPTNYIWITVLKEDKIKRILNKLFNVKGKGYYKLEEITSLLKCSRFNIIKYIYTPGIIGSFIYELLLFIYLHKKAISPFNPLLFLALLPLTILIELIDTIFAENGCEILILCSKQI